MRRVPCGLSLTVVLVAGLVAGCTDSPTEPSRSTAAPPVALATADNGAGLSITTDKDDYAPGDTVQFIGAGWPANDVLDIVLSDDAGDVHEWTINVGADGTFRDSTYVVDTEDLGVTFTLTATSRATGEALTVTFTDGDVKAKTNSTTTAPTITVGYRFFSVNTTCTDPATETSSVPNVSTAATSIKVIVSGQSLELTAPATASGQNFVSWTSGGDTRTNRIICVVGATAAQTWQANYAPSTNHAPTVDAEKNAETNAYSGNEGSPISLNGDASDADNDPLTILWTYSAVSGVDAGATCSFSDASSLTSTVTCTDDGEYQLTLSAQETGTGNPAVTSTATLTIANVAPSVSMTSPTDYSLYAITDAQLGSAGFAAASFTDPGSNDTHKGGALATVPQTNLCKIDWGEGTVSLATAVTEPTGSTHGSCSSPSISNPYADNGAGIYLVTVTVIDDDGGSGYDSRTIVVYDPDAGFVTGGGWINSLAGYCKLAECASAAGKANFGFVSKYKKGASVPTGNTEFQFQAGNLNFHSDTYEWLVVNQAGTNAQFKGNGVINGQSCSADWEGKCRFMLWATDETKSGGVDKFRIQIWTEASSGATPDYIYDNGSLKQIDGGSIQVQTGKK